MFDLIKLTIILKSKFEFSHTTFTRYIHLLIELCSVFVIHMCVRISIYSKSETSMLTLRMCVCVRVLFWQFRQNSLNLSLTNDNKNHVLSRSCTQLAKKRKKRRKKTDTQNDSTDSIHLIWINIMIWCRQQSVKQKIHGTFTSCGLISKGDWFTKIDRMQVNWMRIFLDHLCEQNMWSFSCNCWN